MVSERKHTGRAVSMPVGLTIGSVISMGITLMLAGIIAWLVDRGSMPIQGIGYGAMVTLFTSAVVGALVACGRIKRMRLQVCLISGGLYYLLLLSMTALFFGAQYQGMGVTGAVIGSGVGCVLLLGMRKERGGKRRYRKHINR